MITFASQHWVAIAAYLAFGVYLMGYVLASNKGRLQWWDSFLIMSIAVGWPVWFLIGLGVKLAGSKD